MGISTCLVVMSFFIWGWLHFVTTANFVVHHIWDYKVVAVLYRRLQV
ncbi:MAG: hypothetical protein FWF77_03025 [Defluviitaleaceae bacterium]|nr:hypothetical protein [Defluviitaleaceae bacterium]